MYHLIGLGSNWHAESQMKRMLSVLKAEGKGVWVSDVICTPPCGNKTAPDYLNAVALLHTDRNEEAIYHWCKQQEVVLGRGQFASQGECESDFDLLLSWCRPEVIPSLNCIKEAYYLSLAKVLVERWKQKVFKAVEHSTG